MSKRKCASCGSEMDHESGYWHESYKKDICDECYRNETKECQLCGRDDLMPSDVSEFILVKAELGITADKPPGIYRILNRPFLSIPIIGSESMDGGDVLFIDKLPQFDRHYHISGHTCNECAKPYESKCRDAYKLTPKQLRKWRWSKQLWWLEIAYTREVILKNTDMLRDLENDKDGGPWCCNGDWKDLQERYRLPDNLPTFHEYCCFEHQGVKVFGEDPTSWLALSPEPKYRYGQNYQSPLVFAASSLPTFTPPVWHDSHSASYYKLHSEYFAAMLMAVERGILRQDGCFDESGKQIFCR